MRILITGATGFVGGHLIELLRTEGGHELFGINRKVGRNPDSPWPDHLFVGELTDLAFLKSSLKEASPEWVFHLAGYASPGQSKNEPEACRRDNLTATEYLYESVASLGLKPRILFVSTGLVYGEPNGADGPYSESSPFRPETPYAESKVEAEALTERVVRDAGLDVVRVRPFNHIGPRQSPDYAVAKFARQIVAIKPGDEPAKLETRDLSGRRDLSDVRDIVAAYRLLIEHGVRGEVYNAGSGTAFRMGFVLKRMIELAGVRVEKPRHDDPNLADDAGMPSVDTSRLRAATGWTQRYSLDRTLEDVLTYWRAVAARTTI